jgi:hypothetical protein
MRILSMIVLLSAAASSLSGCGLRPRILSAHASTAGGNQKIEVKIPSSDATIIKSRQLYFSLVVANCDDEKGRFPMEAYIGDQRAAEFKFSVSPGDVTISGMMPASIYRKYDHPCATLGGAGYFTGQLKSASVPIRDTSP